MSRRVQRGKRARPRRQIRSKRPKSWKALERALRRGGWVEARKELTS